jgi:hypothetical protein
VRNWILPVLMVAAMVCGSLGLHAYAYAQGAAEVAPLDAGIEDDGFGSSPALVAPVDPSGWDFLGLPWGDILMVFMAGIGGLLVIFRAVAPLTATTKDDWVLGKLEWLSDLLSKIFVPGRYRSKSLGGGKDGSGGGAVP